MKSNFLLIGTLFLFLTFSTSCSSDDDGDGGSNTAAEGTLKANVDGLNFESTPMATSLTIIDAGGGKSFFITATDLEGRNLTLQIALGYDGEGTYDIGGQNTVFVNATWVVVNTTTLETQTFVAPFDGDAVRGTMTISSDDGSNVQGTFEFTAGDNMGGNGTVDVTNGSFNIDY